MSTNTDCNPPNTQGSLPTPPFVIEELIAKHQAGVWRYLRALGCDGALADDLNPGYLPGRLSPPVSTDQ